MAATGTERPGAQVPAKARRTGGPAGPASRQHGAGGAGRGSRIAVDPLRGADAAGEPGQVPAAEARITVLAGTAEAARAEARTALSLATSTGRRALGLLLGGPDDQALLLLPCNDVHTVGMRRPLDIAFVDRTGTVVESHCAVGPLRRLRNGKAVAVVERFSSCTTPWFSAGDRLSVSCEKGVGR